MPLGGDQPGPRQHRQMRRHGVLRHLKQARHLPRRQPIGLMPHDQPKSLEPRGLPQSDKHIDGVN